MATFYKDFNKEVNDLLTKNFPKAETWKIEIKGKGPNKTVFANPKADNNGVGVDVEYNVKELGLKTKTAIDAKLNVKPKVTYDKDGHKVDFSIDKDINYDIAYEGKFGKVAVNDKLNKKNFEAAATLAVAPHCFVGAGVVYGLQNSKLNWSAGMRYASSGKIMDILTNDAQKFTTGISAPIEVAGKKIKLAFQADCTRGGGFNGRFGFEMPCIVCPVGTFKANANTAGNFTVAYIAKLANNWKSIVSVDAKGKVGVLFSQE